MPIQRYSVNQHPIETLITWIKSDVIAIPDIQRPFVWNAADVRDFIDSLYNGYPVGYLITWQNPDVRLKDGTRSTGKRILIDGQQRVTALLAALLGQQVVTKDYKRTRITIAFHPIERRFEVANAAIRRDREWIADIASFFTPEAWMSQIVAEYCKSNPDASERQVDDSIRHLLRKAIDYFCHLAVTPEAYSDMAKDDVFASTDYFRAMEWLKNEKDDLYNPSYTDMLRVTFTSKFSRGRLADLVALLSGRNFEARTFEEAIAEETFNTLKDGTMRYMNETNFKKFCMILRSAGFVDSSLIRSQNTVNFAYILYLTLRAQSVAPERIETLVRRWFVMSVLTGRYTNLPETTFGVDIRNIENQGASGYLDALERADLSDAFWKVGLPQQMDTSVASSPYFNVFLASQIKNHDKGFLSRDITVRGLIEGQWNIHHVYPRSFLQKHGYQRGRYNQIANYVVMQSEINITIGDKPPATYFSQLWEQCRNGATRYGGITDAVQLQENLATEPVSEGRPLAGLLRREVLRRRWGEG